MAAKLRKFNFNMVEIAVAIAIVAFGISAIMGVFPTILKQGRRATEDNHITDVASLVKGLLDNEYKNSIDFTAFIGKFNEDYESRTSDYDVTDDPNIKTNTTFTPIKIYHQEKTGNSKPLECNFTKRMRFNYYKGSVIDDDSPIIATYDIDIKKQPIDSLNINGKYYKKCEDCHGDDCSHLTSGESKYRYEPGVTITVKISTPAGLSEEEQESFCFQYDYLDK